MAAKDKVFAYNTLRHHPFRDVWFAERIVWYLYSLDICKLKLPIGNVIFVFQHVHPFCCYNDSMFATIACM